MTWTYSNAPATVPRDAVRLYVGDTDIADQLISDEVIAWALSDTNGVTLMAAARVSRFIATKFAREFDQAAGDTKRMLSQRAKAFLTLSKELEGQAGIGTGAGTSGLIVAPIVTGVSNAEIWSVQSNPDRPSLDWPAEADLPASPTPSPDF